MGPGWCGVPPRTSLLPPLLLLLLVLAAGPGSTVADRVVERLKDGFDYYYKITDYALGNASDYQLAPVTSACECRRWCQVSTKCNSVSVVKVAGGGVVECRVSRRPVELSDINDRPRLNKTQGAIHFLFADKISWEDVGQTGVTFRGSGNNQYWSYCKGTYCEIPSVCSSRPCTMAVLNTWDLLEDFVTLMKAGTQYCVYLKRPAKGEPEEWGPGWGRPSMLHSDSEINTTTLEDKTPSHTYSGYTISHVGHSLTFRGRKSTHQRCLCMDNPLNLEL